jgi:predicted metalloendopeptidase
MSHFKKALPHAFAAAFGLTLGAAAPAGAAPANSVPPASSSSAVAGNVLSNSVLPGDDFFMYTNGEWFNQTEIPPDRNSWGSGAQMVEETNQRIMQLVEALAKQPDLAGQRRQVNDFYRAMMDEAAIEARGLAGLKPQLQKIDAIDSKTALAHVMGQSLRADVDPLNSTTFATPNLFGLWVAQDLHRPGHYAPFLLQGGLGMPDRVFYLDQSERMGKIREQYRQYVATILLLSGAATNQQEADSRAARLLALETQIATSHASREASEDINKADNQWQARDFGKKAPGLDWKAFFAGTQLGKQAQYSVWHPDALKGEAALVAKVDLATWKDWLRFHAIDHHWEVLPKAFVEAGFSFHEQTLNGTPQIQARWKRALEATNKALPDAVGKLYVAQYFPAENKVRVQQMVSNIIAAFSERIKHLDWMAPATKAEAQAKLKALIVGVGYPDQWKSYDGLQVALDDALGNKMRAEQFYTRNEIAKLGQKVNRSEWCMPAQLVNAVNLPVQNAMNFPAAILQPPFFDPKASDAVNYGSIGATIGHEISHSFDDQGAQFDSMGRLRNWWGKNDLAHFQRASQMLVAQYSAYQAFPDLKLNGQLNLSENLADLAGLSAALDALHQTQAGKPVAENPDQPFFIGYGISWRNKMRESTMRRRILTDGHAPAPWRTATVRNLDAWYKAFNVQPGQKLYLSPEQRVRVW